MDKREFLKASGAVVAGRILGRAMRGQEAGSGPRENWAGNLTYSTDKLFEPATVEEVQQGGKEQPEAARAGNPALV